MTGHQILKNVGHRNYSFLKKYYYFDLDTKEIFLKSNPRMDFDDSELEFISFNVIFVKNKHEDPVTIFTLHDLCKEFKVYQINLTHWTQIR